MVPRKHPRFIVHLPAFFTRGQRGKGTVLNLSREGCCLQNLEAGVELKGLLTLHLYVSDHEPPLRVDTAHVCWNAASSVGVRFLFMEAREHIRLEHYIAELASRNAPTGTAFPLS